MDVKRRFEENFEKILVLKKCSLINRVHVFVGLTKQLSLYIYIISTHKNKLKLLKIKPVIDIFSNLDAFINRFQ